MPHPISGFDENLFLTYPHNNSFADQGRSLILGGNTETESSLWRFELEGKRTELCRFVKQAQPEKMLWSDTAYNAQRVTTIADNKVWLIDLARVGEVKEVYRAPEGHRLHPIPGIRADGRQIICGLYGEDTFAALLIEVASGATRVLFEKPWMVDHFHFVPFDPEWIGFSHEGNCAKVMDRVWAWHATEAPQGKCYFDQMPAQPERVLYAGHERWSFHDRSVLIVAYGDGPARPRGIYEAFVDGRPQRLISEGDRDMHLDVSRDGRWIAIDTSGPRDRPGKGWEDADCISDILVAERATGERRFVARTRIIKHPSHPHPVFSPDGRHLYFNDPNADGTRNRVMCAENPFTA